ncbi:hypothetical protein [Spongiimicrobium sp. 2-473A-2-J]|uniref:hypothetical protein n=1 Tax=Eudoraea algarum TaxID=3417568 RepID=UPI003D360BBC
MALGKRSLSKPKVYKFVHQDDEYIQTNIKGIEYKNERGWLEINKNGRIYLNTSCYDGYAWDGCTPKFELFDFLIGTPDGKLDYGTEKPITYFASMTHDLLYQLKRELPLSRKTVDVLFYLILKDSGFIWSGVYYFFVRAFGGILFPGWKTKEKIKNIVIEECSWIERTKEELKKINLPNEVNHPFLKI